VGAEGVRSPRTTGDIKTTGIKVKNRFIPQNQEYKPLFGS